MDIAVILLVVISLVEASMWLEAFGQWRRVLAMIVILVQSISLGLIVGIAFNIWSALLLIISAYRLINLLRFIDGKTEPNYLKIVVRRSSLRLIGLQLIIGLGWLGASHLAISEKALLLGLSLIDALAVVGLGFSIYKSLKRNQSLKFNSLAKEDLPSVSVLIPARNETVDLEACLTRLLTSTYPKLEILVLDDCSQDKHTPLIIKGFAQAGVRFIAGKQPPKSWLAKNYAYQQLLEQASGDILVFAGVDTRFSPDSLNNLITYMLSNDLRMISVMPKNYLKSGLSLASFIMQPVRYAWELVVPRYYLKRPPVLSTCWAIYKDKIDNYGSFKAISRSSDPERYFAAKAYSESHAYNFIMADSKIGLFSQKTFGEQFATAVRTRYPQTHRQIETVGLLSIAQVFIFLEAFYGLIWGLTLSDFAVVALSLVSLISLSLIYQAICQQTYLKFLPLSLIIWPIAVIYDIATLNYSMWQYEFNQVEWKGRNVCLPIMHYQALDQERLR